MKEINLLENSILENKNGLYRLAYSYVRNKEDSLDIVQETIYKAFKNYKPDKVTNIRAWLYGILANTAIDTIRKNKKYILCENGDISEKEKFNSNVNLRANQCQTQFNLNRSEAVANGTLSEEESNQIVNSISGLESNVENVLNSSEASAGNSLEPGISDPGLSSPSTGGEASCTGILGNGDTLKYTKMALTIIQIGGVVLAIILSMIDFMGAIMSGDADINKKFSKKLMIRVTMAAILLLVPALLKFILNTFGLSEYGNSFCIL